MNRITIGIVSISLLTSAVARGEERDDVSPEYIKVTIERAQKIVASLGIENDAQAVRVREIIARQYRDLNAIHTKRDTGLAGANQQPGADKAAIESAKTSLQRETEFEQYKLHYAFLARLGAELTSAQVEQVKDGLTYNVVPITFQRYQQLLPSLSEEQKRQIHALLLEAREHAMDAGKSEAKHALFGKYKGRINNYLSAAGFDLKAAERALQEKERTAKPSQ